MEKNIEIAESKSSHILNSIKKEVERRRTQKPELSYGDYYGCEWHDSGAPDPECD